MKNFRLYSLLVIAFAFLAINAQAQDYYKLQSDNSKLIVEGTSTVHDWQVEATEFDAETRLSINEHAVSHIADVKFTTPSESLESGKRIMDNKIQEALQTKKHPEIKFELNNTKVVNGDKATIAGLLTIAGKTKEVDVSVDFDPKKPERFGVKGEVPLKMSEFNIEPPTAMMGTIKTGDDVVVKFDLEFERESGGLTRSN